MNDQPIYMLNALWFKKNGGAKKYREYMAAVEPIIGKLGASVKESYKPEQSLIGDWQPDLFFVVEYPSQSAFESLRTDPEYHKIMHLRGEALENSLLVRCSKSGSTSH